MRLERKVWMLVGAVVLCIIGSVQLAGVSPSEALMVLWNGNFGSATSINDLLKEVTPLLLLGMSVYVALRAGLFNIGAEGQYLVGAVTGAAICLKIPGLIGMVAGMVGGAVAGSLWALPAGWIRAYRNGHEVITTIMMNNIALQVTAVLVAGVLKDPSQQGTTTRLLAESSRLGTVTVGAVAISWSVVIGIVAIVLGANWLSKYVGGYELRAVGENPIAATFAGIQAPRTQLVAMLVSGAIAGLAGALQVLAYEGRFFKDFSPGYGFDALGVALLAGGSMLGVIPAAVGFAILNNGRTSLSILGVPKGITSVILGLMIVVVASVRYKKVATHE